MFLFAKYGNPIFETQLAIKYCIRHSNFSSLPGKTKESVLGEKGEMSLRNRWVCWGIRDPAQILDVGFSTQHRTAKIWGSS